MILRDYQSEISQKALRAKANILVQLDTGAGKTPVIAKIASEKKAVLVAHRTILIKQISKTLAQFDIKHNILAPKYTRRLCELEHRKLSKSGMITVDGDVSVVSIDTLASEIRRGIFSVELSPEIILIDEAHHVVKDNKWGKLAALFPNAQLIGFTATPVRLDGGGLLVKDGGVFDILIQADELTENSVSKLIEKGFLSEFKAYSLPEHINIKNIKKVQNGDYVYKELQKETHRVLYQMCGDAVKHYKRLASGKRALVVCVDIEAAKETAIIFKKAGYTAAAIHSKMSSAETSRVFELFDAGLIQLLCSVDMIGEGVDVPAIEVLIMMRKTASFGLYRQWCGRALRPSPSKKLAVILDHAGNVLEHGLPDKHVDWAKGVDAAGKKSNLIACKECRFVYPFSKRACPNCGHELEINSTGTLPPSDIRYIDQDLIHVITKQIRKELKEKTTLLSDQDSYYAGLDGAVLNCVKKIVKFVAGSLIEHGVSIQSVNKFLRKTDVVFWFERFSINDVGNHKKARDVYVDYTD